MRNFLILLFSLAVAEGCTYQSAVSPAPSYDVYSGYDDKVPGAWALSVTGQENLVGEADMVSYACSAHNYPFNYAGPFTESTISTLGNLVADLQLMESEPTYSSLSNQGLSSIIRVNAEKASTELEINTGFWTGKPRSEVRITSSITVEGEPGRLMGTTVSGTGTSRISGNCAKGAEVIKHAAQDALEDLMRNMGERLSNSPRVREYARGELHRLTIKGGAKGNGKG